MANPTELGLTSSQADAKAGNDDARNGIEFITESAAYFDLDTNNNTVRNRITKPVNDLRFVKTDTGLGFGVWSGRFQHDGDYVDYAGGTGTLTDDATNLVYLTSAGVLTVSTSDYPDAQHFPIATVLTGSASAAGTSGLYDADSDVTDDRPIWSTTGPGLSFVESQSLVYSAFEDNLDTTGYIDFTGSLPAGAFVIGWQAIVSTGFTGDTTADIQVGIEDYIGIFSADTAQSVLAAATVGSATLAATGYVGTAVNPRVTVTGGADFGSITAGSMTVKIYYTGVI